MSLIFAPSAVPAGGTFVQPPWMTGTPLPAYPGPPSAVPTPLRGPMGAKHMRLGGGKVRVLTAVTQASANDASGRL